MPELTPEMHAAMGQAILRARRYLIDNFPREGELLLPTAIAMSFAYMLRTARPPDRLHSSRRRTTSWRARAGGSSSGCLNATPRLSAQEGSLAQPGSSQRPAYSVACFGFQHGHAPGPAVVLPVCEHGDADDCGDDDQSGDPARTMVACSSLAIRSAAGDGPDGTGAKTTSRWHRHIAGHSPTDCGRDEAADIQEIGELPLKGLTHLGIVCQVIGRKSPR
jgi:hypothetical protein